MIWQDVGIMVANFVFAPALIVSIIKKAKYPLGTSLPTALALTLMFVCFITSKYYLSAFAVTLTATCWYILLFRRGDKPKQR